MSKPLQQLMDKEVSRKEFLGMAGLVLMSIFGLGTIVKLLTEHNLGSKQAGIGYGSSAYGGVNDS